MVYLNYLLIILGISVIGYLISLVIKNSSIADVFWGLYFVAITDYLLFSINQTTTAKLTLAFLINVWGFRLSFHIFGRLLKSKKEDRRYVEFREKWGNSFYLKSLIFNFFFQGLLAFLIAIPVIMVLRGQNIVLINWAVDAGIFIWLIGFLTESVADYQMSSFIKKKTGKDEILNSGLWRYSRHPNYFGELVQWWSIWLICFGLNVEVLTVFSPLLLSVLILFVSGIPLAEKRLKGNSKYNQYVKITSVIIPWPPKKI